MAEGTAAGRGDDAVNAALDVEKEDVLFCAQLGLQLLKSCSQTGNLLTFQVVFLYGN